MTSNNLITSHPWRNLDTITDFDTNEYENINEIIKKETSPPLHQSLLIEALIQSIIASMEKNKKKRKQFYNNICENLHNINLICKTYKMEEFENLRKYYQFTFSQLFNGKMTIESISSNYYDNLSRYNKEYFEIKFIASGGFGEVYEAKHLLDGHNYAVKKVYLNLTSFESVNNILKEVKTYASLNHSNIVPYKTAWIEPKIDNSKTYEKTHFSKDVYDSNSNSCKAIVKKDQIELNNANKFCCLVPRQSKFINMLLTNHSKMAVLYIQMSLCDQTLKQWIEDRNLSEKSKDVDTHSRLSNILSIFKQILKGLHYIHSEDITHHDLKPNNIFVRKNNELIVQLGDFGLSCPKISVHEGRGTELYAAPEQLNGICDKKNDIYSLGIILFELVSCFTTQMERIKQILALREKGVIDNDDILFRNYLNNNFRQFKNIIDGLIKTDYRLRPSIDKVSVYFSKLPFEKETIEKLKRDIVEKDLEISKLKQYISKLKNL